MGTVNLSDQHLRVAQISTSVDEFQIRQTTYNVAIKLEVESGPIAFNAAYTRDPEKTVPIYCTRRSPNLACQGSKVNGPSHFSFYFLLEKESKKLKQETCTLLLEPNKTFSGSEKNKSSLLKYAVNVQCPCINNEESKSPVKELFPDCTKVSMADFNTRSSIRLGKHAHDCEVYGLAQEYLITITEFDFSEATLVPYEAQKILSKRVFEKEIKNTHGNYFDEIKKPFDATIICKDGYEIDVHSYILSTRNQVFKKMFHSTTKLSGRGSSFRQFAREAFNIGKSDRLKKSSCAMIDESEISSIAMEVILYFIYFGELEPKWNVDVAGVLHGAQKYGLKQLQDFIDVLLITSCKQKNAVDLLKIATRYSLKGAESAIRDYIFTNLGGVLQAAVKIERV